MSGYRIWGVWFAAMVALARLSSSDEKTCCNSTRPHDAILRRAIIGISIPEQSVPTRTASRVGAGAASATAAGQFCAGGRLAPELGPDVRDVLA
eukprot:5191266-Alexandrium_andersonii.AAC.1